MARRCTNGLDHQKIKYHRQKEPLWDKGKLHYSSPTYLQFCAESMFFEQLGPQFIDLGALIVPYDR